MKIPYGANIECIGSHISHWCDVAARLSIRHDIYIDVKCVGTHAVGSRVSEVYFAIGDNKFDNLKELRKTLKCKAFL